MPLPVFRLKIAAFLFIGLILLSSCEKDRGIVETQLVITKADRSIPTDYTIVGFDTYDENHIFAVGYNGDKIRLFLSANGGGSWNDITDSFDNTWNQNIEMVQSVVYMSEGNLGFIIDNRMHRSFDGGISWIPVGNGGQVLSVFCAEKTVDDNLILVENRSSVPNKIFKCDYNSSSLSLIATVPTSHVYYDVGRLHDDYLVFLDYEDDYYYDHISCFNLSTNQAEQISFISTAYEYPVDGFKTGDNLFLIRKTGKLDFVPVNEDSPDYSFYNYHNLDYYSGEDMEGYFVAVGEKTISTNINGNWEEALNPDLTGQKETFRKVKKIDDTYFYVSGNKGLFFKATFK